MAAKSDGDPNNRRTPTRSNSALLILWVIGSISLATYVYLANLSFQFEYVSPDSGDIWEQLQRRPILWCLALFGALFSLYLGSLSLIGQLKADARNSLTVVVGFGILFRVVFLFSIPIQEIDIYRYIWDGQVIAHGDNPYQYSPLQVRGDETTNQASLLALRKLADRNEGLETVVNRIHFEDVCTIYPPVSQFVFALAAYTTPKNSTPFQFVLVMKLWLLLFDIGTLFVMIPLLVRCGRSPLWVMAYAWCPLVLKEFANGGHLDSVAVFLCTLAVTLAIRASQSDRKKWQGFLASGFSMSLAIGAKIFPAVLLPMFGVFLFRNLSWRKSLCVCGFVAFTTGLLIWPQISSQPQPSFVPPEANSVNAAEDSETAPPTETRSGLARFVSDFEMNDFLFMLVYENLRPELNRPKHRLPWFAILPSEMRTICVQPLVSRLDLTADEAAFQLAKIITLATYLAIVTAIIYFGGLRTPAEFAHACFLGLAWFWLLSPTQNPWYWCWCIPLLPFAKQKTWYLMSGLALIYYARFWFNYHYVDTIAWPVENGRTELPIHFYRGDDFFYYIVVFLEFAPWFLLLSLETLRNRFQVHSQVESHR